MFDGADFEGEFECAEACRANLAARWKRNKRRDYGFIHTKRG